MKEFLIKAIAIIGGFFVGAFAPVIDLLIATGMFVVADIILGIWAAYRRKDKITSKAATIGIAGKLILWPLIVILAGIAEYVLPEVPFIKGAGFLIIAIEGWSILENIETISGKKLLHLIKVLVEKGKKGLFNELSKNSGKRDTENEEKEGGEDNGNSGS